MASSPQHEPTMEEILASIRKIISEDSSEPQPAAPELKAAAPAPVEADVLELTQEVHEEPVAPRPAPAPIVMPAPEPVAAAPLPPVPEDDVVFESIEEPPVTQQATAVAHEGLFSDKTRKAMEDSFASIDHDDEPVPAARPSAAPVAPVDARTIEAVFEKAVREAFDPVVNEWLTTNADAVVERMKPLIREWMDAHFPALLEGAVRAEVERVAKARGVKR
jgi:uncharacterized protein